MSLHTLLYVKHFHFCFKLTKRLKKKKACRLLWFLWFHWWLSLWFSLMSAEAMDQQVQTSFILVLELCSRQKSDLLRQSYGTHLVCWNCGSLRCERKVRWHRSSPYAGHVMCESVQRSFSLNSNGKKYERGCGKRSVVKAFAVSCWARWGAFIFMTACRWWNTAGEEKNVPR